MAADRSEDFQFMLERLSHLEKRIYGKCNSGVDSSIKVLESINDIDNRISTALTGREKVKSVLKRLDDVEKYLDSTFARNLTLEDTAKVDIILAEEPYIRRTASQLEMVKNLKPVLTSEHIQATPLYADKLSHLNQIHLQQEETNDELHSNVRSLMEAYNNVISMLTKQFLHYNDLITKLEVAQQPKTK